MATQPAILRAFSGGELAPELHARADQVKYVTGLRRCRNFFVRRGGGVSNRSGTRFINGAKVQSALVKLYRFVFTAADESLLIEAGDLYFRFYQNGILLTITIASQPAWSSVTTYVQGNLVQLSGIAYYALRETLNDSPDVSPSDWYPLPAAPTGGQAVYEIKTPYTGGSFDSPGPLRFSQSGAVITITHVAYAPAELQNLDPLGPTPSWILVPITTAPSITAPTNLNVTAGGSGGGLTLAYVVTAVSEEEYEESIPSSVDSVTNANAPTETAPVTLTWTAVAGAVEYRIYKDPYDNGTFGYIGTATGQADFNDVGFAPDFDLTPPIPRVLFNATNDYPEMSTFYQQRRLFGYSHNAPATVWASRIGFRSNFTISSPVQDDDAVTFTLQSNEFNVLRHLVENTRLVVLTETAEFLVMGDESGALLPTAINLRRVGTAGSSRAFPATVGSTIVHVQARGNLVRDLVITPDGGVQGSRDLTVYSSHLFDQMTIARLEYAQAPHSIVWAVRSDGTLLGLTYLPEHDVYGWHRHDTGASGIVEDICVVPEADEDVLYLLVRRTINAATVRYIERLEARPQFTDALLPDAFFLDCGITYSGTSTTAITGLSHLEGQSVFAWTTTATGQLVQGPFTVSGGAITLTTAATKAQVGLAITAEIETLPLDVTGSDLRAKRKAVQALTAIVEKSLPGWLAGPDDDHLLPVQRESWQSETTVLDGAEEVNLTKAFTDEGRTLIQHVNPTPLTILGLIPQLTVGG